MEIEVDTLKLQNMVLRLCGPESGGDILAYINTSSEVDLSELIHKFIINGADRRTLLSELRRFRINDADIADAFSEAINKIASRAIHGETE